MQIREILNLETGAFQQGVIKGEAVFSDGYSARFHLSKNSDGPVSGWPLRLFKRDTREAWNNHDGWTPNPRPSLPRCAAIREHFADIAENLIEIAFQESAAEEAETERRNDLRFEYARKRSAGPAMFAALAAMVAEFNDTDAELSPRQMDALDKAEAALTLATDDARRRFKARPIGADYFGWPFPAVDADDARERYAFTSILDLKDAQGRSRSYLPEEIEVEEVVAP